MLYSQAKKDFCILGVVIRSVDKKQHIHFEIMDGAKYAIPDDTEGKIMIYDYDGGYGYPMIPRERLYFMIEGSDNVYEC